MTQDAFIDKLFDDIMFSPSQKRAWLKVQYGVKYTDELPSAAKSALIDLLKKYKDDKREFQSRFKRETEEE